MSRVTLDVYEWEWDGRNYVTKFPHLGVTATIHAVDDSTNELTEYYLVTEIGGRESYRGSATLSPVYAERELREWFKRWR